MKRIIKSIIFIALCLVNIIPIKAIEYDDFAVHNNHLYEKYQEMLEDRKLESRYSNEEKISYDEVCVLVDQKDFASFDKLLNANNSEVKLVNTHKELTISENKVGSVITINESNNKLIYMEVEDCRNSLLFVIDGEKFVIYTEGDNVLAKSEDGATMYLSKYDEIDNPLNTNARISSLANTVYSESNDAQFIKDVGPGSKTNKELVYITSLIGEVGQTLAEYGIVSATLGTVSIVLQIGVSLYDNFTVTYYIRYWQAYKKTDTSYWREKRRYFSDKNYDYFICNKTYYFYTTQP